MSDFPDIYQSQLQGFQEQYDQLGRESLVAKQKAAQTGELTGSQLAAAALTSLLPIAIGGLISGGRGVQAGGLAGQAGLDAFNTQVGDKAKQDRLLAETEAKQLDAERRAILSQKSQFERDAARDIFREGERNKRESSRAGRESGFDRLFNHIFGEGKGLGLPDVTGETAPTLARGVETAETGESPAEVTASTITPQQEAALAGMGITQNVIKAIKENPDLINSLNPDIQKALAGTQQIASREQDFQRGGVDLEVAEQTKDARIQQETDAATLKGLETSRALGDARSDEATRLAGTSVNFPVFEGDKYVGEDNYKISFVNTPSDRLEKAEGAAERQGAVLDAFGKYAQLVGTLPFEKRTLAASNRVQAAQKSLVTAMLDSQKSISGGDRNSNAMLEHMRDTINMSPDSFTASALNAIGVGAEIAEPYEIRLKSLGETLFSRAQRDVGRHRAVFERQKVGQSSAEEMESRGIGQLNEMVARRNKNTGVVQIVEVDADGNLVKIIE